MAEHNKKGEQGEQIAQNYLTDLGYIILERNWRFQKAEVDIIAKEGDFLVFVEVKCRSTDTFGEPQTFISEKKQSILKKYFCYYKCEVVSIVPGNSKNLVKLTRNTTKKIEL